MKIITISEENQMNTEQKYTNINKKYLADAMAFLGFGYLKFQDKEGKTVYTFENTERFNTALHKLLQLRETIAY